MKCSIKFIVIILFGLQASSCNGQHGGKKDQRGNNHTAIYKSLSSFKLDTVAYMEYNFVTNRPRYERRELSYFFKDLEVPIHNFSPGEPDRKTMTTNVLIFNIYNDPVYRSKIAAGKNPLTVFVRLNQPLPYLKLNQLSKRNSMNIYAPLWDEEARIYLATRKIIDITLSKAK
jgi:hypothetical protein